MKQTTVLTYYVQQYVAGFMKGKIFLTGADLSDSPSFRGQNAIRLLETGTIEVEVPEDNMDLVQAKMLEQEIRDELIASQKKIDAMNARLSAILEAS